MWNDGMGNAECGMKLQLALIAHVPIPHSLIPIGFVLNAEPYVRLGAGLPLS
jgi:hypothetical protein